MINRPIPPSVRAIMLQIDCLIEHPDISPDYFSDVKSLRLESLTNSYTINQQTYSLATWLHLAGRDGLLTWIYNHCCDTNPANNFFLLHWAVLCRQPENVINELISYQYKSFPNGVKDADLPHQIRFNQLTPLHLAVLECNTEMANIIITASQDPEVHAVGSTPPLHIAIINNDIDMISLFIKHSADLNSRDFRGNTPLHLAMRYCDPVIAKILIDAGANYLLPDSFGNTSLHIIADKNNDAVTYLEYLNLHTNKGVNDCNKKGKSPFSIAAAKGNLPLLARWLNAQPVDDSNITINEHVNHDTLRNSIRIASKHGHHHVVDKLLPQFGDIKDECTGNPGTALFLAARYGFKKTVFSLCRHLLTSYIRRRSSEDEYVKHTYFFVKRGAGYSKTQKLKAAKALLNVLDNKEDSNILRAHYGALHNSRLGWIFCVIQKFYLTDKQMNEPEQVPVKLIYKP